MTITNNSLLYAYAQIAASTVWDAWVDPANPPARATAGVALARAGMRVEMIVVARNPVAPKRS